MKAVTKSYKTTIFGLIAAIGALLLLLEDFEMQKTGATMLSIGLGGMGVTGRDHGVTSEEAGAKW